MFWMGVNWTEFKQWSQRRKYHNNDEYKEFSAPEKEISIVHLTWDELQHLLYFPFKSKKYQKVRDFSVSDALPVSNILTWHTSQKKTWLLML